MTSSGEHLFWATLPAEAESYWVCATDAAGNAGLFDARGPAIIIEPFHELLQVFP